MSDYFLSFPEFQLRAGANLNQEFKRLAKLRHWYTQATAGKSPQPSKKYKKELALFREKVLASANKKMDTALQSHESALTLIKLYGLQHAGPTASLKQCKQLIKTKLFANIYDFVSGKYINFKNLQALADYTEKKGLFFPLKAAKQDAAISFLLRPLL